MTRWRPSLGFVLLGALAGTLALSFAGLVALRYLGPEIGFRQAAVLLALVITAVTGGLGWLLVRLLLRPIRALQAYAAAQEQGQDAPRPAHYGTSELHGLALRVIAMAEALRNRESTIRAYTNHVTHELKTPVSVLRAACELLEDGNTLSPEDAALLARIDEARAQLEDQLTALRNIARARETRYLGETTVAQALSLIEDRPVLVTHEGPAHALPLAPEGLALVLSHLLRNAAEHGAGEVMIRQDGQALTVQDDGSGISKGNAAQVFDPFFTTRRDSGGTGMGLAIVSALLSAHGGTIRHLPGERGACFEIAFASGVPTRTPAE